MAFQSIVRSESIAAFIPELERLTTEAMDEWKARSGRLVLLALRLWLLLLLRRLLLRRLLLRAP